MSFKTFNRSVHRFGFEIKAVPKYTPNVFDSRLRCIIFKPWWIKVVNLSSTVGMYIMGFSKEIGKNRREN